MRKNIFGYDVYINNEIDDLIFENEFEMYEDELENIDKKIFINISESKSIDFLSSNPKLILLDKDGFTMKSRVNIKWNLKKLNKGEIVVNIYIPRNKKSKLRRFISKFLSIGYENLYENIGQILHELVLIPATFFFQDKVIVHGSCLYNKKYDKSVVFGGTGGVGKTSSLIEMGKNHDWIFLSDDIVVIDNEGKIYPNYAYPKIYAYNTIGDKILEKEILKNKTTMNRFQWYFLKKINPARVRRRISPELLYNTEFKSPKLDYNLFLFRGNFSKNIDFEKIDSKNSSIFEKNIILNEYESFYKFIKWYEYNARALNIKPYITFDGLVKNYEDKYNKIFSNTENYIVKIDISMNHEKFKKEMVKQTEQLVKE